MDVMTTTSVVAHEPHAIRALHARHADAASQAQVAGLAVAALLVFVLAIIITVARTRRHAPRAAEPLAATLLVPTLRDALAGGTYYRDRANTPFAKRAL